MIRTKAEERAAHFFLVKYCIVMAIAAVLVGVAIQLFGSSPVYP